MLKSSVTRFFFAFLLFSAPSCNVWRASETANNNSTTFSSSETSSEIPFAAKEPDVYQTEIVTRIFTANGEKTERKIFTARSGTRRVTVFNPGEKNEITRLELNADSIFSIFRAGKIYAENSNASTVSNDPTNDFLTTEWLNQKTAARFENLGKENGLSKFRVKLGDAENANSEVLIYVDDNLKIPVRQEFYSGAGEQQKVLTFSVELENFKPEAGEKLFELPKDYRKVSPKEFQETLWKERTKND